MDSKNIFFVIVGLLVLTGGAYWAYSQGQIMPQAGGEVGEEEVIFDDENSDEGIEESNEPDNNAAGGGTELREAAMVRAHAAAEYGVSADEVVVVSAMPAEWPDGCLGLGGPGEMCTQAIVPGFDIVVDISGQAHFYRTNMDASVIVEDEASEE